MRRALIALALCATGCDSGFSIGITIERGCLPIPSTLQVTARARPHGEVADNRIGGAAFFADNGQHRIVVIPPPDAESVEVTVVALAATQATLGDGVITVPVAGHALVEETLTLAGACNDGFVPLDLTMPDMTMVCHANADCGGQTPYCDTMTGRCAACLPPSTGCGTNEQCVQTNGNWGCRPGCTDKNQCMGVSPDCCGGACVDTDSDPSHCGGCANACNLPNAMAGCTKGACTVAQCTGGFTDCNGDPKDGCEADTMNDSANCGGCGMACPLGPNAATVVCGGGKCVISACMPSFGDCDGDAKDGCEISIGTDPKNCGACGKVCANGFCANAQCPKRVFVTNGQVNGAMGGLGGADGFCQSAANQANLGGMWQAWLSSGGQGAAARMMTQYPGPYVRLDGLLVANSFTDLAQNGPKVPIAVTETKLPPAKTVGCANLAVDTGVFTATTPAGSYDGGGDCLAWTSTTGLAGLGSAGANGPGWTASCTGGCAAAFPLYCFEQ